MDLEYKIYIHLLNFIKADHVQTDKKQYFQKAGNILLHIKNITREDEGEYVCEQIFTPNGEKHRATYTLKTFRK